MKTCSKCGKSKERTAFCVDKQKSDGLNSHCRECRRAQHDDYYERTKPARLATMARWASRNRQRSMEIKRRWITNHPQERKEAARRYQRKRYYRNIDRSRREGVEAAKKFRTTNPAAWKAILKRQKGKRRAAKSRSGVIERIDYAAICRRDKMRCYLCRRKVQRKDLNFDHVIPLAKGGEHTERNIAVTHERCNKRKSSRVVTLF